jgi:hypothetical protein
MFFRLPRLPNLLPISKLENNFYEKVHLNNIPFQQFGMYTGTRGDQ